ncbi:hypothetical protein DASC09_052310 [Saccharomycopsis crataegensis]|uniref:DASH complex subunit SPC34 n=1 Tax=Saccharomycopsis crataegensis TaxID=43959 RepID=A0AAV5QTN4_9ASCO|nr:hypothetical protein DASC09_052310 [Saccharomycopsis crataegensis]
MGELESLISGSNEACNSISTLYFHSGGIFANSIIKNHEITNLITDLNIDLQPDNHDIANKSGEEQEVQGHTRQFLTYDKSLGVLKRYDGAQYREDEEYYVNNNDVEETMIIKPPKPMVLEDLSMANNNYLLNRLEGVSAALQGLFQKKLKTSSLYQMNHEYYNDDDERETIENQSGNLSSENKDEDEEVQLINSLVEILVKLNGNYPINNLRDYLEKLKSRNISLSKELDELLSIGKDITVQLKKYNIDLNDRELLEFQKNSNSTENEPPIKRRKLKSGQEILQEKRKELENLKKLKDDLLKD